jgi:hypothetical protein
MTTINSLKQPTMQQLKTLTIAATASFAAVFSLNAAMPSQEEMWKLIQEQQKQIAELKARVDSYQTVVATVQTESARTKAEAQQISRTLSQTQAQLDATTSAVEEASSGTSGGWWEKTSVGGYGELHANFKENADDQIDFHRFVLFVNHDYNDWISLYTELELEHSLAGEGKPGEVELEQAFVRMDWTENFSTDIGLYLQTVGLLNETHEPNTFYGVERNAVEKYIIPTTWWEGGIRGHYRFANGVSIGAGISSGLDSQDGYIRGGRQKVAKATFNESAFTGNVNYTGIAGLNLGASVFYQSDIDQTAAGETSALLTALHANYRKGGFGLRALYAAWDLDGDVDAAAEDQSGYYIEPSYRFDLAEDYGEIGFFVRFSDYNYFDSESVAKEREVTSYGVNYWPTENVVLKADVQNVKNDNDSINLGFGYQF